MTKSRSLLVIAAGYIVSLTMYSRLPGPYLPDHQQFPFAQPAIAFMLPTASAVTYALLRSLWGRDQVRSDDLVVEATYNAIVLRIVVFLVALHVLLLANLAGVSWVRAWAGRAALALLGLALMSVGNLLPRTRPNLAVGIRTARTVNDRQVWMQIHRTGGYVVVCLGAVVIVSGVVLGGRTLPNVLGTAAGVAAIVLFAAYQRHARA